MRDATSRPNGPRRWRRREAALTVPTRNAMPGSIGPRRSPERNVQVRAPRPDSDIDLAVLFRTLPDPVSLLDARRPGTNRRRSRRHRGPLPRLPHHCRPGPQDRPPGRRPRLPPPHRRHHPPPQPLRRPDDRAPGNRACDDAATRSWSSVTSSSPRWPSSIAAFSRSKRSGVPAPAPAPAPSRPSTSTTSPSST